MMVAGRAVASRLDPGEPWSLAVVRPLSGLACRLLEDRADARRVVREAIRARPGSGTVRSFAPLRRRVVALCRERLLRRDSGSEFRAPLPRFTPEGRHVRAVRRLVLRRRTDRELVRQLVRRLQPEDRLLLILHDGERIPLAESCNLVGLSPRAAARRLHRARLALCELVSRAVAHDAGGESAGAAWHPTGGGTPDENARSHGTDPGRR